MYAAFLLALATTIQPPDDLVVEHDDTVITRSCTVVIPPGTILSDTNDNGVLHVRGDGITIRFHGDSLLRGSTPGTPPENHRGIGLRAEGCRDLTIIGLRAEGFRVGIDLLNCPRPVVRDAHLRDLFRQHLLSTHEAEVASDWLSPHNNDAGEWVQRYGAAIHLKRCEGAEITGVTVRTSQNGVILDRVQNARIYDNDCSFLSGWGLALWRSSGNLISRNALDFCVRGYSHGVYNRGQDSAGLLMFEQCQDNIVIENSITHGGDGIFGFAGQEALNSEALLGCNRNVFQDNDLSFAPAHGLEMTFSADNRILRNRFEGNAICGIWGGYSKGTIIEENEFLKNGDMAYGLERGGINIEHGSGNRILFNRFLENRCGVHLWDDSDPHLTEKPWIRANHRGSLDEVILGNRFEQDVVGIHLRDSKRVLMRDNEVIRVGEPRRLEGEVTEAEDANPWHSTPPRPIVAAIGKSRPVFARPHLRGRRNIIMTEYGPWDHASPLLRSLQGSGALRSWSVQGLTGPLTLSTEGGEAETAGLPRYQLVEDQGTAQVDVALPGPGLHRVAFQVTGREGTLRAEKTATFLPFSGRIFPYIHDPRTDYERWRKDSETAQAQNFAVDDLRLVFGMGGPESSTARFEQPAVNLPKDRFGIIASCNVPLESGRYVVRTRSDDGVRVRVAGQVVLENWTWHGPTEDTAEFSVAEPGIIAIEVEYFELDGYAVLTLEIAPLP